MGKVAAVVVVLILIALAVVAWLPSPDPVIDNVETQAITSEQSPAVAPQAGAAGATAHVDDIDDIDDPVDPIRAYHLISDWEISGVKCERVWVGTDPATGEDRFEQRCQSEMADDLHPYWDRQLYTDETLKVIVTTTAEDAAMAALILGIRNSNREFETAAFYMRQAAKLSGKPGPLIRAMHLAQNAETSYVYMYAANALGYPGVAEAVQRDEAQFRKMLSAEDFDTLIARRDAIMKELAESPQINLVVPP